MSPSKDEIKEACIAGYLHIDPNSHVAKGIQTIWAALRASEARNALLERQYIELKGFPCESMGADLADRWNTMLTCHAREREALK